MFDVIVITAANEAQAAGYHEQVSWRLSRLASHVSRLTG